MNTPPPAFSSDTAKLAELIKDVRVAMFTTFPAGSAPHTRPMYTQRIEPAAFDGTLWFMAATDSPKLRELVDNSRTLITYAAPDKNRYIAVLASASPERNAEKARELWTIHAKGWWPGGPTDPSLTLIRANIESAEYWDGPSNTSYMFNLLKAVATNSHIKLGGEHGSVKM
ncbi:hypothetical protein BH11PLA1_BH11PLA1_01700 [soil metagenome]